MTTEILEILETLSRVVDTATNAPYPEPLVALRWALDQELSNSAPLTSLTEHNEQTIRQRKAKVVKHIKTGIACPKCLHELEFVSDDVFSTSGHKLKKVSCSSCSWRGEAEVL